ncbi:hypothetical protein MJO28_009706 [Puccinia striiformis f. sp. tritici]|uniref:Uncharacterized protein n=1 Tax=Puccinia striiformis f. sp. tritici TaxID=168172 RepID=A0ACC0E893_9BASI|nr:hypothetical protein MJO28_009706 [Puccinia striiformis f. sp. tritici]
MSFSSHVDSLSKRTSAHVLFFFSFFQFVQQRKHDPAAYDYSPSFQAVPQTYDFANLFELHALELAAAITSTSHSGSGTKSDGSSIAYLLMPSSSTNPLLSSMFNDQELLNILVLAAATISQTNSIYLSGDILLHCTNHRRWRKTNVLQSLEQKWWWSLLLVGSVKDTSSTARVFERQVNTQENES